MAVIYDTPITTPSETGKRVATITIDYDASIVVVLLKDSNNVEDPIRVGSQALVDIGRAEYTLAQFMAFLPGAAVLNTDLETALVGIGRINPGTVS